ncbi:hypothetical protein MBLNU230_g0487t1 [Neophaeotheca triangularis]
MASLGEEASTPIGKEAYSTAPTFEVPSDRIVSIEHPCIIRNLDNGIKSLGGEPQIRNLLDRTVGDSQIDKRKDEPQISARLRPNDPFAKWVEADGVKTRNILVKITVPKRTGRKRKRGSSNEFMHDPKPAPSAQDITSPAILRRMREAQDDYTIEAIGLVNESHRFRKLPDFQSRLTEVPIFQQLRQYYNKPSYDSLKYVPPNLKPGNYGGSSFPPPPTFIGDGLPHLYEYQQPPHIRLGQENGTGELGVVNTQRRHQKRQLPIDKDQKDVPTGPWQKIPELVADRKMLARAVDALKNLLEERPIITRRVANNRIQEFGAAVFNEAVQHVAYGFKNGPFRDVLIKYGVDPRKDPEHRFYQSFMFQIDRHTAKDKDKTSWGRATYHSPSADPVDHIFDGTRASINGKVWQVCDLTDPILQKLLNTDNYRKEFDNVNWGWFHNGTVAKVRTIMRDKLYKLSQGVELPHEEYEIIAQFPDEIAVDQTYQPIIPSVHSGTTQSLAKLAADFRTIATSDRYNRRYGFGSVRSRAIPKAKRGRARDEDAEMEHGSDEDALGDLERLEDVNEDGLGDGPDASEGAENTDADADGNDVEMDYESDDGDQGEEGHRETSDVEEDDEAMFSTAEGGATPRHPYS